MRERAQAEAEQRNATKQLLSTTPTMARLQARSRGRLPVADAAKVAGPQPKPLVR